MRWNDLHPPEGGLRSCCLQRLTRGRVPSLESHAVHSFRYPPPPQRWLSNNDSALFKIPKNKVISITVEPSLERPSNYLITVLRPCSSFHFAPNPPIQPTPAPKLTEGAAESPCVLKRHVLLVYFGSSCALLSPLSANEADLSREGSLLFSWRQSSAAQSDFLISY